MGRKTPPTIGTAPAHSWLLGNWPIVTIPYPCCLLNPADIPRRILLLIHTRPLYASNNRSFIYAIHNLSGPPIIPQLARRERKVTRRTIADGYGCINIHQYNLVPYLIDDDA